MVLAVPRKMPDLRLNETRAMIYRMGRDRGKNQGNREKTKGHLSWNLSGWFRRLTTNR